MKIDRKKHFIPLSNEQLMLVTGSWSGWGAALQGLLGGLAPSPTLDQLNGRWPIRNPPKACGPYGTGGTPNSCNGL